VDDVFKSDQSYRDVVISCNYMVLLAKAWGDLYPEIRFDPSRWGSNSCEELFAKARCFLRHKYNFSHLEFLQICSRIRNVDVAETNAGLSTRKKKMVVQQEGSINWPTDEEIITTMELAESRVMTMLSELNMISILLTKGLVKKSSGQIVIADHAAMRDVSPTPFVTNPVDEDELDTLDNEELEAMTDTEIFTTVMANDPAVLNANEMIDVVCDLETSTACSSTSRAPTPHASTSRAPTLQTSTSRASTARSSGATVTAQSVQSRSVDLFSSMPSTVHDAVQKHINTNTHVFYQGHWYHIARFVAWEQGRIYMPKMARLTRFFNSYAVYDTRFFKTSSSKSIEYQDTCVAELSICYRQSSQIDTKSK
jgi:hypothetical protein